ncbi:transcription initiation factor TFIID subunit 11-like [Penaeus monodon]|uniref:transcription initiation factor TFIID subunit 11-like n=1 Tax=Penaeus monodon TaxID=6687 RepID=UPI0018A742A4|nr:transcription initiation factor TFIID subunit 11-like [Penaeus monodon]
MVPARKSRRQSKPPAKLQDFVYEDGREKEKGVTTPEKKRVEGSTKHTQHNKKQTPNKPQIPDSQEPRRSGRTPKLSEKLKSYLNDKGDAKTEVESTAKKQSKKALTSHGTPTDSIHLKEPQVTLRKLPVSSGVKNLKPHTKSQNLLRNKSPRLPSTPERNVKGNERQASSKRKKMTKRKLSEMEGIEMRAKPSPSNPQRPISKTKKTRVSTNGSCERLASESDESQEKDEEEEAQEDEDREEGRLEERRSIDSVRQINKDMMTQLLNFGAEIAEAMASSNEKLLEVINKENNLHNSLHTFKIEGDDDFDEEEADKILDWLEKEELQRGAYRKKIIDSMRASHESNMTLFNQLLKKLQSLSSSLRC